MFWFKKHFLNPYGEMIFYSTQVLNVFKFQIKPIKIFRCICPDGFTGDFCEFKTEQNKLLYINDKNGFVMDEKGQILDRSLSFDDNIGVIKSCSTMLNGEAVIFGGSDTRQVMKFSF